MAYGLISLVIGGLLILSDRSIWEESRLYSKDCLATAENKSEWDYMYKEHEKEPEWCKIKEEI